MKSDTRRAKMAALFEDDPEIQELLRQKEEAERRTQEEINAQETVSREAESVLAFLRKEYFVNRQCKNCEGDFLTNYGSVAYCGDPCRIEALKKIGIYWDPSKPLHERWGSRIPLVLGPELIENLESVLHQILAIHSPQQETQMSEPLQDPVQVSAV